MKHRPDSPGWSKQNAQLAMAAIRQNLWGPPLTPQTPAIATRPTKPLCQLFCPL